MSDRGNRLADKVAIVTGSSRGLGKGIAQAFAREGAAVCVTYRQKKEEAEAVTRELRELGAKILCAQLDVTKRAHVKSLFEQVNDEWGQIDILVNNAGINKRGMFLETTDEDWDDIMNTNLKSAFICSQEVFPYMISQGSGRIINISSVAGQYHGPKTIHYAVSKAGLNSLTKVIARYGAEHNILVNAVAPGLILTDQTRDEFGSAAGNKVIDMTLLKKAGEVEDVSSTCILLASDEQSYITGQVISVSGGAYLA